MLIRRASGVKSATNDGVVVSAKMPVSNKPLTGSSRVRGIPKVAPDEKSKEMSSVAGKTINRL